MVISFLTDYGHEDEFVGVCHAVMAGIAPDVRVIDLAQQRATGLRSDVIGPSESPLTRSSKARSRPKNGTMRYDMKLMTGTNLVGRAVTSLARPAPAESGRTSSSCAPEAGGSRAPAAARGAGRSRRPP